MHGGLSVGAIDAVTQHVTGAGGATIEPATNYGVLRLRQDLRGGESSVGAVVTTVNRSNDSWSSPYLHSSAYVGAADFRHRFPGGRYELSGSVDFSQVAGSAQAIAATQRDATHYYQRPDAGLKFDSTRTTLSGDVEGLQFGKVGGNHFLFQTNLERRSPGFEINDLGYLQRADQQAWSTWAGYFDRHNRRLYRRLPRKVNSDAHWGTPGGPPGRGGDTNTPTPFHHTPSPRFLGVR